MVGKAHGSGCLARALGPPPRATSPARPHPTRKCTHGQALHCLVCASRCTPSACCCRGWTLSCGPWRQARGKCRWRASRPSPAHQASANAAVATLGRLTKSSLMYSAQRPCAPDRQRQQACWPPMEPDGAAAAAAGEGRGQGCLAWSCSTAGPVLVLVCLCVGRAAVGWGAGCKEWRTHFEFIVS